MSRRRGFTLVELLTVIAIIGVLLSLLLPAIQSAREAARRANCRNNLRQVALALTHYYDANKQFPPGKFLTKKDIGVNGKAWSWLAEVLPFIEEAPLHKQGRVGRVTLAESGILDRQISVYLCPSDPDTREPKSDAGDLDGSTVGQTNYQAVSGANWGADASQKSDDIGTDWRNPGKNGSFDRLDRGDGILIRSNANSPRKLRQVTDGTSKTFLIDECVPAKNRYASWPYANNAYATCAIPPT